MKIIINSNPIHFRSCYSFIFIIISSICSRFIAFLYFPIFTSVVPEVSIIMIESFVVSFFVENLINWILESNLIFVFLIMPSSAAFFAPTLFASFSFTLLFVVNFSFSLEFALNLFIPFLVSPIFIQIS